MKRITATIGAAVMLFAVFTLAQSGQPTGCVQLAWTDPSPAGSADLYCLYHSTNVTVPLSNWVKIATAPPGTSQAPIFIAPGQHFFFMTASNAWGESFPSNVTGTAPMLLPVALTIRTYYVTNSP